MTSAAPARRWGAELNELLGSMRFAVSLLVFICIASVIGTVLQQNQAANLYIDQFGLFWFGLFDVFSVGQVYNSWWFLGIMGFLVVSTTLCLVRNTPKMLRDMRSFREHVRLSSLRAFPHRVELESALPPAQLQARVLQALRHHGYRWRVREDDGTVLVAARKGGSNRLGYVFAHAAIVVICIGGLLDSELPVRMQVWWGGKQPITENMLVSEVPATGRLAPGNPSFRGTLLVPEGRSASHAIVNVDDGVLVQPLPFGLTLKRFIIEYYSTGMPSLFRSEVEVTDPDTGETFLRNIEVNEPLRYKGVTVYQSSFDDGGSKLQLIGHPLGGARSRVFDLAGDVGQTTTLALDGPGAAGQPPLKLELTGLRVINVENLSQGEPQGRSVREHVAAVTGTGTGTRNEHLRNVGPSVEYRIIGADGQATEFVTYMLPIELEEGLPVFLAGVRRAGETTYRYLRLPADEAWSMAEFMDLRAALNDPAQLSEAVRRFALGQSDGPVQRPLLEQAARGALESFTQGGLNAIIERAPEAERERLLGLVVPMIQLSLQQLRDVMREQTGRAPIDHVRDGEAAERWLQSALLGLANLPDYPAPVLMTLKTFEQSQASVFQITRSPGTISVYLGCLFLIIGVFTMFYIRDRRIWVWLQPRDGSVALRAAMTSQRRTLDFEREFAQFRQTVHALSAAPEDDRHG